MDVGCTEQPHEELLDKRVLHDQVLTWSRVWIFWEILHHMICYILSPSSQSIRRQLR